MGDLSGEQIGTVHLTKDLAKIFTDAGMPAEGINSLQQYIQQHPQQAQQFLEAVANGDTAAVEKLTQPIKDAAASRGYTMDTSKLAREAINAYQQNPGVFFNTLSQNTQNELLGGHYFCGVTTACDAAYVGITGFGVETGASEPPPPPNVIQEMAAQPIPVTSRGRVDPVGFYAHAVDAARQAGLDGKCDNSLRSLGLLSTCSAEEWGRLYTMMAKQESNFNIYSSAPSECSYGILQFCPGEYGLGGMSDVRNPQSSLNALINVTQQGRLFQYFGSLQRPSETAQHAAWFDQAVAPYTNGDVPYSPISLTGYQGSGNDYWAGVAARGGEPWVSPGYNYGSGSYGSGGGSFIAPFAQLFGSSRNSTSVPPITRPQPPPAPLAQPTQAPIEKPAIALISQPSIQVNQGGMLSVYWATVGISASAPCTLTETKNGADIVRSRGNAGSFSTIIDTSYTGTVSFKLACTPEDSRVTQSDAQKTLSVTIF